MRAWNRTRPRGCLAGRTDWLAFPSQPPLRQTPSSGNWPRGPGGRFCVGTWQWLTAWCPWLPGAGKGLFFFFFFPERQHRRLWPEPGAESQARGHPSRRELGLGVSQSSGTGVGRSPSIHCSEPALWEGVGVPHSFQGVETRLSGERQGSVEAGPPPLRPRTRGRGSTPLLAGTVCPCLKPEAFSPGPARSLHSWFVTFNTQWLAATPCSWPEPGLHPEERIVGWGVSSRARSTVVVGWLCVTSGPKRHLLLVARKGEEASPLAGSASRTPQPSPPQGQMSGCWARTWLPQAPCAWLPGLLEAGWTLPLRMPVDAPCHQLSCGCPLPSAVRLFWCKLKILQGLCVAPCRPAWRSGPGPGRAGSSLLPPGSMASCAAGPWGVRGIWGPMARRGQ